MTLAATGLLLPLQQFFSNNGEPAAGYFLYTYIAGGDTPLTTFSESTLSVANTNPIELDSSGRCVIYTSPTPALKLILKTDLLALVWSQDMVSPAAVAT